MPQAQCPTVKFNEQLSREADRVLADLIFARAPIQSRLLKFLVDRTISGTGPITQYEIAVDGLGKPEDYLVDGDSYPRVQISRLRRNLENYYSRNLPENGFQIALEPGKYRLTLERREKPAESRHDATQGAELTTTVQPKPERERLLQRLGLPLVALVSLAAVPFALGSAEPSKTPAAPEKPSTTVVFDTSNSALNSPLNAEAIETARWISTIQLSNSFVSRPLPVGSEAKLADYTLHFNVGSEREGATTLFLTMADRKGDILYSNSVPFSPDRPSAFSNEIESSLVTMTSPTGVIAEAELSDFAMADSSDYACFLAVEGRRSQGEEAARLVDRCIAIYPNSEYQSFWLARRAFMTFQSTVEAGEAVQKSGKGWEDLQAALEADQFNAFANFVAAKVELADGNCDDARSFVMRALERGGSYPALIAAVETNAAACSFGGETNRSMEERVRALTEFNPDPDPLLRLYMIVGSLAAGDRALAEKVARRTMISEPQGAIEETVDLLKRAFADPRLAIEHRDLLAESIYSFVWNERATMAIVDALGETNAPARNAYANKMVEPERSL